MGYEVRAVGGARLGTVEQRGDSEFVARWRAGTRDAASDQERVRATLDDAVAAIRDAYPEAQTEVVET